MHLEGFSREGQICSSLTVWMYYLFSLPLYGKEEGGCRAWRLGQSWGSGCSEARPRGQAGPRLSHCVRPSWKGPSHVWVESPWFSFSQFFLIPPKVVASRCEPISRAPGFRAQPGWSNQHEPHFLPIPPTPRWGQLGPRGETAHPPSCAAVPAAHPASYFLPSYC